MSVRDDMAEKFGEEDTEQYLKLARALRSLNWIWEQYVLQESGSHSEEVARSALEEMLTGLHDKPDHLDGIVEGMLALVYHMRIGGSYEEWFLSLGIAPAPGVAHG